MIAKQTSVRAVYDDGDGSLKELVLRGYSAKEVLRILGLLLPGRTCTTCGTGRTDPNEER